MSTVLRMLSLHSRNFLSHGLKYLSQIFKIADHMFKTEFNYVSQWIAWQVPYDYMLPDRHHWIESAARSNSIIIQIGASLSISFFLESICSNHYIPWLCSSIPRNLLCISEYWSISLLNCLSHKTPEVTALKKKKSWKLSREQANN